MHFTTISGLSTRILTKTNIKGLIMTADEALQLTINSPDIKFRISEVEKSITEAASKGHFSVDVHPNSNFGDTSLDILAKVFQDRGFTIKKLMRSALSDTISCLTIKWA